mmetsp:Transcript_9394/g.19442  ORF Transcript_9394/g.19442 Transcript_9394/m.19442 type:complete len:754 (-) Transcript_9394:94-2355(-)
MSNAFGGFLHISPLSSLSSSTSSPPEPAVALSSNCIRDYFGPVAQSVADCLNSRGPSTLNELVSNIRQRCLKVVNEERGRLVDRLNSSVGKKTTSENEDFYHGGKVQMNKARGPETAGYVTDASHIRAALIVLLHHSLVSISGGGKQNVHAKDQDLDSNSQWKPDPTSPQTHYTYTLLNERARLLPRYPRYVEHAKEIFEKEDSANIVECLLMNGRMRGEEVIQMAWDMEQKKRQLLDLDYEGNMEDKHDENDDDEDLMQGFQESPAESKVKFEDDPGANDNGNSSNKFAIDPKSQKILTSVVKSFQKLIEAGYIEMVKPIATSQEMEEMHKPQGKQDGINGGEVEFDMNEDGTIVGRKKKRSRSFSDPERSLNVAKKLKTENGSKFVYAEDNDDNGDDDYGSNTPDHPEIKRLLSNQSLRKLIPPGSVYRVNTSMFHSSLRSQALGRLVKEMYSIPLGKNSKTPNGIDGENPLEHVGAIVTAALTHASRQEHAPTQQILGYEESEEERHHRMAEWGTFTPSDIVPYLPSDAKKSFQSQVGGMIQNLSSTLVHMTQFQYPPVVVEVEEARGHPSGGKFEICTRQLLQRLRERILHRILSSHQGLVAARIVSILQVKGHCESDAIAEDAMVPAKEAREILHRLHREKYINLFDMHMTKTHNSATAIYLWHVIPARLLKTVFNNVCTALLNLRLRRQHEVEVGKDWMDRAKEAATAEENANDEDKKKYLAFCKGLERLDNACLQLDETLMVLKDF